MESRVISGLRAATPLAATAGRSAGCEARGPAQRAGENCDRGVRIVQDAISLAGPVEKVGRAVDRIVNPQPRAPARAMHGGRSEVVGTPARPKALPDEVDAERGSDSEETRALSRWLGIGPHIAKRRTPHGGGVGKVRGGGG